MMMSAMWLLQDVDDSISSGNSRWLMFFVGMVAVAMLTQAIVFVVAAIGAAKVRKRLLVIAEEVRLKALPVIDGAQDMIQDLRPKLKVARNRIVRVSDAEGDYR